MTNNKKSAKEKVTALPIKKTKVDKRKENFARVVEQFISGKQYRPLRFMELAEKLSVLEDHLPDFKHVLDHLIAESKVLLKQERIYPISDKNSTIRGIIRMNPRGFGFVEVEGTSDLPGDVFIPRHFTKNSVDGDSVEISVSPNISEKGPEGKVISILSRSRTHLAGTCIEAGPRFAKIHVPILGSDHPVILELKVGEFVDKGERIVMEVTEWGREEEETRCQLSRSIGHISNPSCDISCAIEEFEIRSDFSTAALEEVNKWGKSVPQKAIKEREDLRELESFTIDPDTAKDFDDAISLSKDNEGHYHLAVHIADVSHYVPIGSELDKEAFLRANSTYFPGKCVPMLPGPLSDNLCSLKANVNRLTVTVFMDFNPAGDMTSYRIGRTVIKSAKRFTYKEARKVLDGELKSIHKPTLELMDELCLLLKKKRQARGSVEFGMPELVVLVDQEGKPTGTDYIEYDITHQLVEEFMLKANETVATHLDKEGKGVPFRVHDEPSEENLRDFALLAGAFGFKVPLKPTSQDIQKLFEEAMETPYGQYLATSYIRRMRLAVYSPTNIGHFGLALSHYCHFTSPIRRYVDLVAHRLIFEKPSDFATLERVADQCSQRERVSAKAENSVVLLKKYRLLMQYFDEDSERSYQAVITRIKPFGITFEILELLLEGFIHISEIGTDYYEFEEKSNRLRGVRRGQIFSSGDQITVMLKEIDLVTCDSTWAMGEEADQQFAKKDKPKFKKRSKKRR